MISKKTIEKIKYLGVQRYKDYEEMFNNLDENELIELKAEYEASVNAKGDKTINSILVAVGGFIVCGILGFIGKFIYRISSISYKNSEQEALKIMGNMLSLGLIVLIAVIIIIISYNRGVKKSYIRLQYLNEYLNKKRKL